LPDFNTARTAVDASQLTPPFEFDGVVMRVFPLRARLEQLQTFIDAYLNVAPPELAHFRVFLPYVYLMIINYGKMSVTAANLGWISQNEVAFSVPLLWYRRIGRQLVFHDFAYVSPFIYVDNDMSMTTGREVYGWPKSRVSADTFPTAWMTSPEANPVLARFSAMVFPELHAGMRQTPRTLLEIKYSVGSSFSRVPFDPRAAWLPWVGLPKAIAGSVEMARDYADVLRGLGFLREQPGAGPAAYASMLARLSRSLSPYRPRIGFNTINLKQFRDAEHPNVAAYQALTNARMDLRRFGGGGLLGDTHMLQGDASGGFSVDVHQYPTAPIVDSLGLEVASERVVGGASVHTLRPMFPMWLDVDMHYDVGRLLAWRAKGRGWHDAQGKSVGGERGEASPSTYNTARGAAEGEVSGPFTFPSATLRVMPLLADEARLAAFLQNYLGDSLESEGVRALPWGHYVYLVAFSYEEMSSTTNDIGWWAERELVFYVPARLMRNGALWKVVLVPAYAYANSATAALTGAEVSGVPIAKATLESPGSPWMEHEGPGVGTRRAVLSVGTMVLPVVQLGQKAVERVVIEVLEGDPIPPEDEERWRHVAQGWGRRLKEELLDKRRITLENAEAFGRARAHALRLLCEQGPIRHINLKQFRDAEHPTKACYQAVVEVEREITQVHHIEEIETALHVRIHRYPTQPIVDTLGLVSVTEEVSPGGVLVHVMEPVRPFWMKVSLKEHLGRNLFVRAGSGVWCSAPGEEPPADVRAPSASAVKAILAKREPRRLVALLGEMAQGAQGAAVDGNTAIAEIVEAFGPQVVLESILSEEWERWGETRWLRARARIERAAAAAREGKAPPDAALAEFEAFWGTLSSTSTPRAGERMVPVETAELLLAALLRHRLLEFVAAQRVMELDGPSQQSLVHGRELAAVYRGCVGRLVYAAGDERASAARFEHELAELESEPLSDVCRHKIRVHTRAAALAYRDLTMLLARAHQKPYHVIRRGSIASDGERGRAFPVEHCWDEGWYVGPPIAPSV
jgi:hypothetical protein